MLGRLALSALLLTSTARAASVTAFKWRAEDASGVVGFSGGGYFNGTYSFVPGLFGKAVQFGTNTDGGINALSGQALTPFQNGAISISLWIYPYNNNAYIFAIGSESTVSCTPAVAYLNSDNTLTVGICNSGISCSSVSTIQTMAAGAWTHFAMTYANNGTLKVYLNGKFVASTTDPAQSLTPANMIRNLHFGSNAFTAAANAHCGGLAPNYLSAMLDEFGMYNQELTESEIRQLMLNYAPRGG